MAKKKEITTTPEAVQIFETLVTPTPAPVVYKHPVEDRVLEFRAKGFDNNRIAALLGIQKSVIDGIK